MSIMVFPESELWDPRFPDPEDSRVIEAVVNNVREHYDVSTCVVSLEVRGRVIFIGDTRTLPTMLEPYDAEPTQLSTQFKLFRFNLQRDLPIIIADASADERFVGNAMTRDGGVKFYSSAPLMLRLTKNVFVGALCIADREPRFEFELTDCGLLESHAREISDYIAGKTRVGKERKCERRQE
eukprot:TRINITY_DN50949_c0_g1_i1.p1 TRINITY_DN50949_c0_g1~~TRINITY_DN50949_c0_g1_i1.p1  ORF type:complete len:182 (-),score=15.40 TRINITY_DN50949_c0_g1_i1:74-619(-)